MRGAPSPEAGWCGEAVAEHRPDAIARSACGVRRRTVEAGVAGTRGARCGVRRRRSLWLAGGCSRGAGATPGRCADGIVARRASLAGGTSPPGKGVWVPSFPGVGGAPRHQPPANKRERLRRTICAPRNGLAGCIARLCSARSIAGGHPHTCAPVAVPASCGTRLRRRRVWRERAERVVGCAGGALYG